MSSERGRKFLTSEAARRDGKKFLEEPLDTEWRRAKLRARTKTVRRRRSNWVLACPGLEGRRKLPASRAFEMTGPGADLYTAEG